MSLVPEQEVFINTTKESCPILEDGWIAEKAVVERGGGGNEDIEVLWITDS